MSRSTEALEITMTLIFSEYLSRHKAKADRQAVPQPQSTPTPYRCIAPAPAPAPFLRPCGIISGWSVLLFFKLGMHSALCPTETALRDRSLSGLPMARSETSNHFLPLQKLDRRRGTPLNAMASWGLLENGSRERRKLG